MGWMSVCVFKETCFQRTAFISHHCTVQLNAGRQLDARAFVKHTLDLAHGEDSASKTQYFSMYSLYKAKINKKYVVCSQLWHYV